MANKWRAGALVAGSVGVTLYVYLEAADGTPQLGLTDATASLTCRYTRTATAPTPVTLAPQTPTGAWTTGGFCAVDGTATPGLYRVDLPNAAGAIGTAETVTMSINAPGMRPYHEVIPLMVDTTLFGTAVTGTLTTTSITTAGLPTLAAGQLTRRLLEFVSGACTGERVIVVGSSGTNQLQLAPPLTAAPSNGDSFMIL